MNPVFLSNKTYENSLFDLNTAPPLAVKSESSFIQTHQSLVWNEFLLYPNPNSYLHGLIDLYSNNLDVNESTDLVRCALDLLNDYIYANMDMQDKLKLAYARYHQVCVKLNCHKADLCNLDDLYKDLDHIELSTEDAFLLSCIKVKKSKIISLNKCSYKGRAFTNSPYFNKLVDSCVSESRRLLLQVTIDVREEVKQIKIMAHYFLALSCLDGEYTEKIMSFMAKKSLLFVVENTPNNSILNAMANYQLGKLHLYGYGKAVEVNTKCGFECFQKAIENPNLPTRCRNSSEGILLNRKRLECIHPYTERMENAHVISYRTLLVDLIDTCMHKDDSMFDIFNIHFNLKYQEKSVDNCKSTPKSIYNEDSEDLECHANINDYHFAYFHSILQKVLERKINYEDALQEIANTIGNSYNSCRNKMIECLNNYCYNHICGNESFVDGIDDLCKYKLNKSTESPDSFLGGIFKCSLQVLSNVMLDKFNSYILPNNVKEISIHGEKYTWQFKVPAINILNDFISKIIAFSESPDSWTEEFESYEKAAISKKISEEIEVFLYTLTEKICEQNKGFKYIEKFQTQEHLILSLNYAKIIFNLAKKNRLNCILEIDIAQKLYSWFMRLVPDELKSEFLIETARIDIKKHKFLRVIEKNEFTSDFMRGLLCYLSAISLSKCFDQKMQIASEMINKTGISDTNTYEKMLDGFKTAMVNQDEFLNNISLPKDQFYICIIAFFKYVFTCIEFLKFNEQNDLANTLYAITNKHFKINIQVGSVKYDLFDYNLISNCDVSYPTAKLLVCKEKGKREQHAFIRSLLPSAPPFMYCQKVTWSKKAMKDNTYTTNQNTHSVEMSVTQVSKKAALEIEKKQMRKELLKKQKENRSEEKLHSSSNMKPVTAPCDLPHIFISPAAMEIFTKLFIPHNPELDFDMVRYFDSHDFRTDVKIKREEIALLIEQLGGKFIPSQGKGSHTKCTLASLADADKLILNGEQMTFANLDIFENQDSSEVMTFANNTYLKHYSIRQVCQKLINLGFTPKTVKICPSHLKTTICSTAKPQG